MKNGARLNSSDLMEEYRMTIQELEQQLLSLDIAEQLRIIQLLSQNISQTT